MKPGHIILRSLATPQNFKAIYLDIQALNRRINNKSKFYTPTTITFYSNKRIQPLSKQKIFGCNLLPISLDKKQIVATINAKNYNKLCRYQTYIHNKKIKLNKSKCNFIEKMVSHDKNNVNSSYKSSILIYDTASEVKNFNCKVNIDGSRYGNRYYICQDFAVAVANGAKPSEFSSVEAIKNHPALAYQHIDNFYTKIAKEAYYFRIDQLSTVLKSIAYALYKEDNNTTKGYVLRYDTHAMAINVTKEKNVIKIQFYDPNKTNVAKKVIIFHPEDSESLSINDFISQLEKIVYFPEDKAILLSSEKLTETSAATINILTSISEMDLGFLLVFGHYKTEQNIADDIIIKPIISQVYPNLIMVVFAWAFPSFTAKIPYYYKQVSGFYVACISKHLDAISSYVADVLSSNNSIEDKISVIFSPLALNVIKASLLLGDSNLWEVVVKCILKNKHISSSEKVMLLTKIVEKYQFPIIFLPMANPVFVGNDEDATKPRNIEVQLASFKKLANYILATDDLTETEKTQIIKGKPVQEDYFWFGCIINLKNLEKYFPFFDAYLKIILNCDKISEPTKNSLLDLNVKNTKKEKILYEEAINNKNFQFTISYIEQITKSSLSLIAKQQLLHIKNKDIFLALCTELAKTNPELSELYTQVVNKNVD